MKKRTYYFMIFLITSFFAVVPLHARWLLPYIIKNNSSEGLWSNSTSLGLILDQCNRKIKLITHICCSFRINYWSSHQTCSMGKGLLRNSTKFRGKHQCQTATLSKKGLWHRCFPVNFTKFLRTHFLQDTSERLLL